MCMPGTYGSQNRVPDSQELELWMIMNGYVGTGN